MSLNRKNLPLRFISVLSDAIVYYFAIGLLFAFFGVWNYAPGMFTLAAISTVSLLIGLTEVKAAKPLVLKSIHAATGMVAALLAVLSAPSSDPFMLCLKAVVLLALWFISIRKAGMDVRELFTIRQFFIRLTAVALSAALIGIGGRMAVNSIFVIAFTAAYLFGLLRAKRFSYMTGGQDKKRPFIELAVILVSVLVVFLLVSPAAVSALAAVFTAVYGFLSKLLLYIVTPIAWLISALVGLIQGIRSVAPPGVEGNASGEATDLPDYSNVLTQSFLERISGILLYIILAAAAFLMIYLYLRKHKSRRDDADTTAFREERESVLNFKSGMRQRFTRLGSSLGKGIAALQRLNADNAEKVRHEYRRFLHILYKDNVLRGAVTADAIAKSLAVSFAEADPDIMSLTVMYEETRYGRRLPTDEEYREFKKKVGRIVEIVGKQH